MPYQRTPVEWPEIDPATVAPLRNMKPDMFNYMPTRNVTRDEAQARGWSHFYIGQPCKHGHMAPRFVSNPNYCVDCKRIREGRSTIGVKTEGSAREIGRPTAARVPVPRKVISKDLAPKDEPDSVEKCFLKVYAQKRDFVDAAKSMGRTPGEFQARLSYSRPFREAVRFLEEQYDLAHTMDLTEDFEWTEDKRAVLLRVYVNTGDLAEAIRVTGCTNWAYEEELKDNPEFAAAVEAAVEGAKRSLAREAISRGRQGNDRLFQAALEANLPEYSKRMDINFNVRQLTDEQINQRLFQLLERTNGIKLIESDLPIEGEIVEDEPGGAPETVGDPGAERTEDSSESNLDLL